MRVDKASMFTDAPVSLSDQKRCDKLSFLIDESYKNDGVQESNNSDETVEGNGCISQEVY